LLKKNNFFLHIYVLKKRIKYIKGSMRVYCTISVFIITAFQLVYGQIDQRTKTEEAVNYEEKFANARREMLIYRYDRAITILEELYKEDRTNAAVCFELAKAYLEKKDQLLVEKYLKAAIANAPTNVWYMQFQADLSKEAGNFAEALVQYQKMYSLQPKNLEFYLEAITCLTKLQRYKEAILEYDKIENAIGPDAEMYMRRFELYAKLGAKADALKQLDFLIGKYNLETKYLKAKARYLIDIGKEDEALDLFKKILAIDPEDTDANLAILSKGNEKDKPNAYLMALLPIISNTSIDIDAKVRELLPYVQRLAAGQDSELARSLKEVVEKLVVAHPTEAKAYSIAGDIYMSSGDVDGAIIKYEKTLKLNNKVFAVWEQLMYGYNDKMDYNALLTTTTKALDIFPNQSMVYYFNGLALSNLKKYQDAKSIAQEGIMVSGKNEVALSKMHTALATALIGLRDYEGATTALETALRLSGNKNAIAYEVYGDLYMAKNDSKLAQEYWKKSELLFNKSKSLYQKLNPIK
jgi:tetratricopeptide (TPR) repeat protein